MLISVICTVNKTCILRQISIKDVLHCKIWLVYITRNTLQRCISRGDFQMGIPHFQMAVLRIQCRPKYVGGYCGADCLKGMQNTIVRVECQILIKRNGVGGVRGSPHPTHAIPALSLRFLYECFLLEKIMTWIRSLVLGQVYSLEPFPALF